MFGVLGRGQVTEVDVVSDREELTCQNASAARRHAQGFASVDVKPHLQRPAVAVSAAVMRHLDALRCTEVVVRPAGIASFESEGRVDHRIT